MTAVRAISWVLALAAIGCASDLSTREAHALAERGALLLDVRTRAEFAERHIENSLNIPIEELQKRTAELGPTTRPIVVYCHTGVRSGIAVGLLRKAGFEVHNLGSIARWYHERADTPPVVY